MSITSVSERYDDDEKSYNNVHCLLSGERINDNDDLLERIQLNSDFYLQLKINHRQN